MCYLFTYPNVGSDVESRSGVFSSSDFGINDLPVTGGCIWDSRRKITRTTIAEVLLLFLLLDMLMLLAILCSFFLGLDELVRLTVSFSIFTPPFL